MQTPTDPSAIPFRPLLVAPLVAVVVCSFFAAHHVSGKSLQLIALVTLALVVFVTTVVLDQFGARPSVRELLLIGTVVLISMELSLRLEMPGFEWQILRLALAAVYTVPALSGSMGYLAGYGLELGPVGRWMLAVVLLLVGLVQVPISALYLVCNFGYDCL